MIEVFYWIFLFFNLVLAFSISLKVCKNPIFIPLSPPLQLVFFDCFFYLVHSSFAEGIKILSFQLILLLSFHLSVKLFLQPQQQPKQKFQFDLDMPKMHLFALGIFSIGLATIAYIFISNGFSISSIFNFTEFSRFYALSRRAGGASFQLAVCTCLFALTLLTFYTNSILHFMMSFVLACSMALLGGRGFILCAMMSLAFIYAYRNLKKLNILPILLILSFGVGTIGVGTYLRYGSLDFYLEKVVEKDFNLANILSDVEEHNLKNNSLWMGSLYDIDLLKPSFISLQKPVSTQETIDIYPVVAARSTNITFGLYPNAFYNLGYLGILMPMLFYFFLGKLFVGFQRHLGQMNLASALTIILLSFQFLWLRGGVINVRFMPLFISMFVAVAFVKLAIKSSRFEGNYN